MDLDQAVRLNPNHLNTRNNRGRVWLAKGELDKALADFEQALRTKPKHVNSHLNRGAAWERKGEFQKALDDYRAALQIDPNSRVAYSNTAWLQATCPNERFRDAKKAFENASRAYQLSPVTKAVDCDVLAAAYAESGDFEQAREWAAKAIGLTQDESYKQAVQSRLELYKQGKPYHKR